MKSTYTNIIEKNHLVTLDKSIYCKKGGGLLIWKNQVRIATGHSFNDMKSKYFKILWTLKRGTSDL